MEVALVCTEKNPVPPVKGGAIQTYIYNLTPLLARRHAVTVFSVADPQLAMAGRRDDVEYVYIPAGEPDGYVEAVSRYLAERRFDIVQVFNRPKFLLKLREVSPWSRFVLSVHNDMFVPGKISESEGDLVVAGADAVVTVSRYVKATIESRFPAAAAKTRVIYSGVDLDQFRPVWSPEVAEQREALRRKFGVEKAKVILNVSRLTKKKGQHILLKAMPEILEKHPDAMLLIVGSKWYGDNSVDSYMRRLLSLADKAGDRVVFTGFIPVGEVHKAYLAGDVFVCASQWEEPLARVHYEAMASGLPIVTTNRGGNAEVIENRRNGLVIDDFQEPDAFAEAVRSLFDHPGWARRMGEAGRAAAEARFGWPRVAGELLDLYDQLGPVTDRPQDPPSSDLEPGTA